MKKLASIFLALIMILGLSVNAVAADETTLKVTPADDGILRSYVGYQLLDLVSMSLKEGDHHPADCTADPSDANAHHKETCYHYAYQVVGKYKEILQKEVLAYAGTSFWGSTTQPVRFDLVTDENILDYFATLTSDDRTGYGTLRKVADRIYREIKLAEIEADTEVFNESESIDKGYWMFVDVTNLSNENNANSLVIVDTLAKDDISIAPKTALPTVTKKVQDIEDSEHPDISNMDWYDSADHDWGDNVPFKLTATLPDNIQYYTSYTLTFHDTLSAALKLADENRLTKGVADKSSYRVFMYHDLGTANADIDLNAGTDVTEYFTINKTTECACTFEVSGNIYDIPNANTVLTPDTVFVVYYEATLLEENVVFGNPGNPNEVYLEFSNDPYSDQTGVTKEDKVNVFTYQFVINKVDQHNHPLSGAEFTLYKMILNKGWVKVDTCKVTEEGTRFIWSGLDDGDYKMEETKVPEGFNGMAPREFTIQANHELSADDPKLISLNTANSPNNGDISTGAMTETVSNRSGSALPETGAMGTMLLIGGGAMFATVAVVFMVTRKKMSIYED